MTSERPTLAYWFAKEPKLPHEDDRPVVIGETLSVVGKLKLCSNGLHWSVDPFDALKYAGGNLLYKVRPEGEYILDTDKGVSRGRTALAVKDATKMLQLFAKNIALSVSHLWEMPPIVREFLETENVLLANAANAVAYVAKYVANTAYAANAAAYAANAAAYAANAAAYAANAAAYAAAHATAYAAYAAHATASAAVYAAVYEANAEANAAANAAAANVAYAAARVAARTEFNQLVSKLFEESPE